jgi:uncharacterized protein YodC (DUF2158 family)
MAYAAGDVVVLKSGGQAMTVISADDDEVECVWLGEEGKFFRHTIPAVALQVAPNEEDEEDDEKGEDEEEVAGGEEESQGKRHGRRQQKKRAA